MKIALSILRIAVLLCLGFYAMSFFFNIENDESYLAFFLYVIFDKAFAVLLAYIAIRLYNRWAKVDKWIGWYDRKNGIETEADL